MDRGTRKGPPSLPLLPLLSHLGFCLLSGVGPQLGDQGLRSQAGASRLVEVTCPALARAKTPAWPGWPGEGPVGSPASAMQSPLTGLGYGFGTWGITMGSSSRAGFAWEKAAFCCLKVPLFISHHFLS